MRTPAILGGAIMTTCLIVAFLASAVVVYSKGKLQEQERLSAKLRRLFQTGSIRRYNV
jgi:hypothetical protein